VLLHLKSEGAIRDKKVRRREARLGAIAPRVGLSLTGLVSREGDRNLERGERQSDGRSPLC
jgi:hypothetical protein